MSRIYSAALLNLVYGFQKAIVNAKLTPRISKMHGLLRKDPIDRKHPLEICYNGDGMYTVCFAPLSSVQPSKYVLICKDKLNFPTAYVMWATDGSYATMNVHSREPLKGGKLQPAMHVTSVPGQVNRISASV